MRGIETILFLVMLGTVVAAFAGRLRVPAPSLLAEAALARLDELAAGECAADDVIDRARAGLQARIGHPRARVGGTRAPEPDGLGDRELHRDLVAAENAELARLYGNGTISQATRQRLQRGLDLEAARLSDEQR